MYVSSEVMDFLISIHAPAKGATLFVMATFSQVTISIHAPAKGATYNLRKIVVE